MIGHPAAAPPPAYMRILGSYPPHGRDARSSPCSSRSRGERRVKQRTNLVPHEPRNGPALTANAGLGWPPWLPWDEACDAEHAASRAPIGVAAVHPTKSGPQAADGLSAASPNPRGIAAPRRARSRSGSAAAGTSRLEPHRTRRRTRARRRRGQLEALAGRTPSGEVTAGELAEAQDGEDGHKRRPRGAGRRSGSRQRRRWAGRPTRRR